MMFTVLWDNDGVLVDTERLFFQTTASVLRRVGVELTREMFIDHSLRQGRSTFEFAAARGVDDDALEKLHDERDAEYMEVLRSNEIVIDGVRETLEQLHGQVRMGVVTSAPRKHFEAAHTGRGLLDYFEFVLAREDYGESKPAPDGYLAAIERFNVPASRSIVIEDTERGLAAAVAAGVPCMVIPHELTAGGDFSAAYRVLDHVGQVPDAVRGLAEQT